MTLTCPSDDDLSALLSGELVPENLLTLELHLMRCDTCCQRLNHLTDSLMLAEWRSSTNRQANAFPYLLPSDRPGDLGRIGRYSVEAELGRGGMGIVFRAWDSELRRTVALKVLRVGRDDEHAAERFQREGRMASQVRHTNLVPVLDVTRTEDGRPVMVMPLIDGVTLRDRLREVGTLSPRESATQIREVADGLATIHAVGMIHRDVKPNNILLDRTDGRAKLADFGLSRTLASGDTLTQDGTLVGTPEYLSPEQAFGSSPADARCDVYSLGITLYECLTGVVPFRGSPLDVITQHRVVDPLPIRQLNASVPTDLETICTKCLSKDPSRRYPTAAQLRDDLGRWLNGQPIHARPIGGVERSVRWCRRNPWPVAFLLLSLVSTVVSVAGWVRANQYAHHTQQQTERAEEHLAVAAEAVDTFYTQVVLKGVLNDPQLQPQQKELYTRAIEYYERMLTREVDHPQLKHRAAETAERLAWLLHLAGRSQEAIPRLHQAMALSAPHSTEWRFALDKLSTIYADLRQLNEATAATEQLIASWQRDVVRNPADLTARRNIAAYASNLGRQAFFRQDPATVRKSFTEVYQQMLELAKLREGDPFAELDLARAEYNMGFGEENPIEARNWYARAYQRRVELQRKLPTNGILALDLVRNSNTLREGSRSDVQHAEQWDHRLTEHSRDYLTKYNAEHVEALNFYLLALTSVAKRAEERGDTTAAADRYAEMSQPLEKLLKVSTDLAATAVAASLDARCRFYQRDGNRRAAKTDLELLRVFLEARLKAPQLSHAERSDLEDMQKRLSSGNRY